MHLMTRTLLTTLLLLGCTGDKDSADSGTSATTTSTGECSAFEIEQTIPENGSSDGYYRGAVEFWLNEPDRTETISLADSAGTDVPGTMSTSPDGYGLLFQPDAALTPNSAYTATLSCGDSISFTTSDLGTDLGTTDLTDRVYGLDLTNARFVYPAGIADLLLGAMQNEILFGIDAVNGDVLAMEGAVAGETGGQDFCEPSIALGDAEFSEAPFFAVTSDSLTLGIAGLNVTLSDLYVAGTFAADGGSYGGGVMAAALDARDLGPAMKPLLGTDDPDEVCSLLVSFGVACEECSSDGAPYCVAILADQMSGDQKTVDPLECVAEALCHPQCADSECVNTDAGLCD